MAREISSLVAASIFALRRAIMLFAWDFTISLLISHPLECPYPATAGPLWKAQTYLRTPKFHRSDNHPNLTFGLSLHRTLSGFGAFAGKMSVPAAHAIKRDCLASASGCFRFRPE